MKLFDKRIAIEDNGTVQNKETEIAIYCKIGNKEGLETANSKEQHLQYHAEFKTGQRCRVRKTVKGENTSIVFTMKIKGDENNGIENVTEVSTDVDEDFLEAFKFASHQFVEKTRYNFHTENVELSFKEGEETRTFTVPDIKYEVDVFIKADGTESEWCKIDVEVDSILNYINQNHPEIKNINMNIKLSHLPFEPTDMVIEETATEDQKAMIKNLWDTEYNRK